MHTLMKNILYSLNLNIYENKVYLASTIAVNFVEEIF